MSTAPAPTLHSTATVVCILLMSSGVSCGATDRAPSARGGKPGDHDSGAPVAVDVIAPRRPGLDAQPLARCEDDARASLGPFVPPFEPAPTAASTFQHGDSVTVDDIDGDGHLDLLLPDRTRARMLRGDGLGGFTDVTLARLPAAPHADAEWGEGNFVAGLGDLDGDADLDIVLGSTFSAPRLLLNDGTGTFVEHEGGLGLPDMQFKPRDLPMADIDGDGDLDLFIAHDRTHELPPHVGEPNILLRNEGDLIFTDISDTLTDRDLYGYTKAAAFIDIDGDIDQDLYIVNHMPSVEGNRLLLNDGFGALASAPELGADVALSGMGLATGDLNADGLPDLLVSGWGELAYLVSDPDGYINLARAVGLVPNEAERRWVAWGNAFADIDNDTDLDVLVSYGTGEDDEAAGANPTDQPDGLYINDGDGTFTESSAAAGLDDPGIGRTMIPADLNGDGWLDLVTHGHIEVPHVYMARCGTNASALITLQGTAPNTDAVGARVQVEAEGTVHTRWVRLMGSGFSSGGPRTMHVGLGAATHIDRITVRWPDGREDAWTDLPTRHHFTLHQDAQR